MIEQKLSLRQLLEREPSLMPCVFDCASARAAELSGFTSLMLSGAELSMSMNGLPDIGLLSLEELVWAVTRITHTSPLPLAVDIQDGFGGPLQTFNTCKRIAKAGATGVLLEDEANPGFAREVVLDNLLPVEEYVAKLEAAKEGLAGTDCMLMARTNVPIATPEGLREGIRRCQAFIEAGADMTVIVRLNSIEDARVVAKEVPGIKLFPDINQNYGKPKLTARDLFPLGYRLVTMHYLMKAAMVGMLESGKHNFDDQSNIYSNDLHPMGVYGQSGMPFFQPQEWLNFEAKFTGEPAARFWAGPLKRDEI